MHRWLKLSHPRHSGRLRPHEYTSYLPLAILITIVGIALVIGTVSAQSPPPQSSSVSLNGKVPSKPPTQPATITSPADGQSFGASPITVSGTCPKNTIIEIYTNDIFVGSTPCTNSGSFSLKVGLLFGKNVLIARDYDALNQTGPDSNKVTVTYNVLSSQASPLGSLNLAGAQLLLSTDAVYRGTFPGQSLNVPVSIIGGSPPYAVNVEWGDDVNNVISRKNNTTFNAAHTYNKPGTFQITLQGSDAAGHLAFLTVAAVVNGQPGTSSTLKTTTTSQNTLLVLWPLYVGTATAVCSFWLGERREKRVLGDTPLSLHPQH